MAPTQFANVVKRLKELEKIETQYNAAMDAISDKYSAPQGTTKPILDDVDAKYAASLLKLYNKKRTGLMKVTAKGDLTKHIFSTKSTASLSQAERVVLKEFLSGEDTTLTAEDLERAGVKLDATEKGKALKEALGSGFKFPPVLTVAEGSSEKEVTDDAIQKAFADGTISEFVKSHKLQKGRLHPDYVTFREKTSKRDVGASAPRKGQQQPPKETKSLRKSETESKEEEDKQKAEEALEKDAAEKAATAGRVELSRKKALERSGAGSSSTGEEMTGPNPPEPPAPVPGFEAAAAPAPAPAPAGPVSDGEKRLASKGLIDNPAAAEKAATEAEEELKRAQMAAINAFKASFTKKQHEGKGAASGTGPTMAPTLETIEDVNESIAADIEESEANRNEAAKTLQNLARLRAKVRAAKAYTQDLRDAAQPDFTNLSTRVSQREAGAPKVSTLPPATQAERIPGTSEAGTDTAPVENLVMENVSRGREEDTPGVGQIMKSAGTTEKDDDKEVARLSIEGAKDRIRALHTVFDELIPAFKAAPHRKDRDDALQSKDEKVVKEHLLSMLKKVREYYSGGPSGLRVGVVIPASAIIQSLLGGAAAAAPAAPVVAAPAPAAAPFGMGGRTPDHPGSVIHKKGSDPYGVGMSIAIHRRNSGMASFMKKGVAGHAITNVEPIQPGKVSKPVIKMNQNAPMNGNMGIVLGRTPKSLGIKIKTGKR